MTSKLIGRLLRAGTTGFVAGTSVSQFDAPALGALVFTPLGESLRVYGVIHDIHIDDDGLVRQLATAEHVSDEVLRDNRERRIVPVEMSVLSVGFEQNGVIHHLLPPRPPLSLDTIHLCTDAEVVKFTRAGRFGYLRHILQAKDIPIAEVMAAHIQQAAAAGRSDGPAWREAAVQEIITQLRDDYPTLMSVLGALSEIMR